MSTKLVKRLLQNTSSHNFDNENQIQSLGNDRKAIKKRKIGINSAKKDSNTTDCNNTEAEAKASENSLNSQIQALLDMDKALLSSSRESQTSLIKKKVDDSRNKTKLRQKIYSKQSKHAGVGNSRSSCSKKLKHEIRVTKDIARNQRKMRTIRDVSKALSSLDD